MQQVEQSGKEFADMFLRPASFPGQQLQLFQMFVRTSAIDKTGQSAAVAGLPAIVACDLTEYEKAVNGPFFTLPGGAEPTAEDRARFKQYWEQGRLRRAGNVLHESPDTNPILRIADGAVELRVPVEIALSGSGSSAEAARGKLLLRATDPGLLAELAAAKAAKGEATQQPPKDLTLKPVEWRVVRIESDLKAIASGPPPQQGGGGPDAGAGFGD